MEQLVFIEVVVFALCVLEAAALVSLVMWVAKFKREVEIINAKIWELNNEVGHHEASLEEHGLIIRHSVWDEYEDYVVPDSDYENSSNVVYLKKDD